MVAAHEELDPIARAWREAWTPPDRRHPGAWAEDHVVLAGDYAKTGPFTIGDSRFLIKPFEHLHNDATRMVNILKAPRTGGSLIGDIWFQHIFKNRPAPTMVTFQTDDDGERHYLTKVEPTLRATPANAPLAERIERKRELHRAPHMNYYIQGANKNNLQGKGVMYEWNDEVWIWKPGLLNQAFSRTDDFKRVCKILNISQGGDLRSDWDNIYNRGKRHDYAVRCIACRTLQPFEFFATMHDDPKVRAGIVWEKTARLPDGRWNIARAAETTRFRCRHCGHEHPDTMRSYERLARDADYFCHDPDRSDKNMSLRWTGLVGGDWARLTEKFLHATAVRDSAGVTSLLEDFYKQDLATFWDPTLAVEKVVVTTSDYRQEPIFSPGYKAEPLPWEKMRIIGADYQQGSRGDTRHLLVVCRAFGDPVTNRSRLLWWGRCNTFADLYRVQTLLGVKAPCVGIDGGFEMMEVAAQCAKYGWTMLVGDSPKYWLHTRKKGPAVRRPFSPYIKTDPLKGKSGQGRTYAVSMFWSNPSIKNLLWNLRHHLTRHDWALPVDIAPEYRDGIDSEIKQWVTKKGSAVPVMEWTKIKAYNHPWDIECMITAIAVAAGLLGFDVEEDEPAPATPARPSAPPRAADEAPTAPHEKDDQLLLLKV